MVLSFPSSARAFSTSRASLGFWARMVDLLEILSRALRQPPASTLAALDTAAPTTSSGPSTLPMMSSTNCLNLAIGTAR
eukprot:1487625-Pyramimonas_sp.AAC.1